MIRSQLIFLISIAISCGVNGERVLIKAKKIQATPDIIFEPGEILINAGKIEKIGLSIKKPEGTETLEWKNLEIYPGLISPGSSLGLVEINALRPTRDEREVGTHTPEIEAWTAVNPDSELIPVARANGITHSVIVPLGGLISGTSSLITLDGWGIEEITKVKKVAVHLWWPGQTIALSSSSKKNSVKVKSLSEQDKDRKKSIDEIDEFFAQAIHYFEAKKAKDKNFQYNASWEALIPILEKKIPLIIHANEKREINTAISWAKKRDIKIIISGARDAWKLAKKLASEEIPVIYRHIFTASLHLNDPHDVHFIAPSILASAGVSMAIGLPLGGWAAANQRNLPYHAGHGIAYGLRRNDAIASITLNPAKMMGLSKKLGSLEDGKEATFFGCTGDIFDIRSSVVKMMIEGKEVELASRHTRLFEKYRNRPNLLK